MLNNFTGGGQVFLHKIRMLRQVFSKSFLISFLISSFVIFAISYKPAQILDFSAAITYQKALFADSYDDATMGIRETINPKNKYNYSRINAFDKQGLYAKNIDPRKILKSRYFSNNHNQVIEFLKVRLLMGSVAMLIMFLVIFILWSRFGTNLKNDKKKKGSAVLLEPERVKKILKQKNLASDLIIGNMPLVKNMETRHLLVTGSTGCGKTNLMHTLLPQIERKNQPAIVIDQTGEMIAKYYDPERGDIIFNPFDERGKAWNFWADCSNRIDLERFSKILIGFNRKQSNSNSNPFWENSAESVFNACVEFLRPRNASIKDIANMVCHADIEYLQTVLVGTEAARYLNEDSKQTAGSIASVLATNAKPLTYLREANENNAFSIKEHFNNIKNGSNSWLFFSSKPSSRSLTTPLIASMAELALAELMEIGIDKDRKIWIIIDELPSLGKLPALSPLMAEGRKYGACVLAGMQSLNQLYSNYGHYDGSTIFGQFGTCFAFRNTEPAIAKMISSMCGNETITRHQKNTSFGANEFRDGVSYNEHEQIKPLVSVDDLASLSVGECYVFLPEPAVRLSKIQLKEVNITDKNIGFIPIDDKPKNNTAETIEDNNENTASQRKNSNLLLKTTKTKTNKNSSIKKRKKAHTNSSTGLAPEINKNKTPKGQIYIAPNSIDQGAPEHQKQVQKQKKKAVTKEKTPEIE